MSELKINYQDLSTYTTQDNVLQDLVSKARTIAKNAYAPYSKFHVGAAIEMTDGTIVLGSNQENIAYPSGLCAERTALFYAGANYPNHVIKRLVIVAKGDLVSEDAIISPCGSCRQVMVESAKRQNEPFEVYLISQNDRTIYIPNVYDLLPFYFGA